jgi:hypothetical protein
MTGNVRWNLYGGAAAFVLTFLASITRNVLVTTLLRSFYSFLLVFAILFLFRFILHLILNGNSAAADMAAGGEEPDVSDTGRNVDLATPNDDSLHDLLRANLNAEEAPDDGAVFTQLKPPKLISQSELKPEELANALRRMSEE